MHVQISASQAPGPHGGCDILAHNQRAGEEDRQLYGALTSHFV